MEKGRGKGTDTLQTNKVFTRKEYIEREALLADIEACVRITSRPDQPSAELRGANKVISRIKAVPAADVVARDCYDRLLAENDELRKERPVVRCNDCRHRDPEDKKCDCGGLEHAHMFPVADDWFCADGERKDGD